MDKCEDRRQRQDCSGKDVLGFGYGSGSGSGDRKVGGVELAVYGIVQYEYGMLAVDRTG